VVSVLRLDIILSVFQHLPSAEVYVAAFAQALK